MRRGNIKVKSGNILPIIKKWLYSDKDIFLRELVSNGCDAVSKLKSLEDMGEAPRSGDKPRITVTVDRDARTITVEDNGIGMTEEEVEKYITQVAFSGAQDFIDRYKDKADPGGEMIGHFGLGFYSVFMVADPVEIDTLSYCEGAKPVHWVSRGESQYEIGEGERTARGTKVTLHIIDGEDEFLGEERIRAMLHKYCAFMKTEIFLDPKGTDDDKPVNDTQPLWLKAPKDCTKEEYEKFYSELFMDFNPPLFWIHLNVDYPFNLKGILYFPKQTSKVDVMPGEIKLYSNQVYVADNIKEIVPEFLMLLKGVIDCPDMPLNVSRSFLQNDSNVQKISKHITKKVSDKLHEIFTDTRADYDKYWDDIAPFIKFGCIRDEDFYSRVRDILLLKSIDGKYLTLSEFPKDKENRIFYVTDEDRQAQYIRLFREQGQSAAVLTHIIDSHFISFIEYKEHDIKFVRIDAEIGDAVKGGEDAAAGEAGQEKAEADKIAEAFKKAAADGGLKVRAERLKDPGVPAVMLLDEYARRMQDMSKLYGEAFAGNKPEETIVLNTGNEVVRRIPALDAGTAKLVCAQITDLARIGHKQLSADEMTAFIARSVELLAAVSGVSGEAEKAQAEKAQDENAQSEKSQAEKAQDEKSCPDGGDAGDTGSAE
jgi:molecular chaperone HtpG